MAIKNFALIIIIALLGLSVTGCPPKKPEPTPPPIKEGFPGPAKEIYDEYFKVSLKVPETWRVKKNDGNPIFFVTAPDAGPYGPMANVVIENLNQRMAPYDYLKANLLTMRISLPGLEIKDGAVELYRGLSMAWIRFTYPRGDRQVEAVAFCQTREFRAYVVTIMSPASVFQENFSLFQAIGRSLKVD